MEPQTGWEFISELWLVWSFIILLIISERWEHVRWRKKVERDHKKFQESMKLHEANEIAEINAAIAEINNALEERP